MAVMSFSGYCNEDAIVMNKAAIDRGFGRCIILRKHRTSVRRYPNGTRLVVPQIQRNPKEVRRTNAFRAIDEDAICMARKKMENGTIMVNKTFASKHKILMLEMLISGLVVGVNVPAMRYESACVSYIGSAPCHGDKVLLTSNEYEYYLIKVMLRQIRRPELGDKFASRHGQKGVCGLILLQEDLPFNEFGHLPDRIPPVTQIREGTYRPEMGTQIRVGKCVAVATPSQIHSSREEIQHKERKEWNGMQEE